MGIEWVDINPRVASRYNLPVEWGVYVTRIGTRSPAAAAGIKVDDIITRVGDQAMGEATTFVNSLFTHQPGETVEVEFVRNGKTQVVQVELGQANGNP